MRTLVYARHRLVDPSLDAHAAALLLEGSWPGQSPTAWRASLDDAIDGRFEWIDLQASHWAEHVSHARAIAHGRQKLVDAVTPAYLNALALRYYLVKLIRVVAYFTESRPLGPQDTLELVAARGRDEDYADLLAELARTAGAALEIRWSDAAGPSPFAPAPNGRLRRSLGKLAGLLEPRLGDEASAHRAVLCGNPRVLDPVCRELLDRGARVWWLADRFAVRSWLAWRSSGVGQLVCDCSLGDHNHLAGCLPGSIALPGRESHSGARAVVGRADANARSGADAVDRRDRAAFPAGPARFARVVRGRDAVCPGGRGRGPASEGNVVCLAARRARLPVRFCPAGGRPDAGVGAVVEAATGRLGR